MIREQHEQQRASREAQAVADMARKGVTFGEPVEPHGSGCSSCVWHVVNTATDHEDGGPATAIRSWLDEGYLGEPQDLVLHPVTRTT